MTSAPKDEGTRQFDPRFKPEFQPGYDPRTHREAAPDVWREPIAAPSRGSVITRPTARTPDAAAIDSLQHESEGAPVGSTADASTMIASEPAHVGETPADEALEWWRRLNPFLIALGVTGLALVGLSLAWMRWAHEAASNPYTQQGDYLMMQFALFGAPVLLAVGVATLVSILVVLAARWRR